MTVSYTVYIDESGDPGLGSSAAKQNEWMVLSAFVVRQRYDAEIQQWADEMRSKFKNSQRKDIHFADLNPAKKLTACRLIAGKPCRFFLVLSHKENMRSYRNERIKAQSGAWYYWWLSRVLLERVTAFCYSQSPAVTRDKEKLRIIFSKRGGLRYADFVQYMRKIERQSRAGLLYLKRGDLVWSMIEYDEVRVLPHESHAGLQMADIGAGAMFQAISLDHSGSCRSDFVEALTPRIARGPQGQILQHGIKVMPNLGGLYLLPPQRQVFEHLGFNPAGWSSAPSAPFGK